MKNFIKTFLPIWFCLIAVCIVCSVFLYTIRYPKNMPADEFCEVTNVSYNLVQSTCEFTGLPEKEVASFYANCAKEQIDIYEGVKACCEAGGIDISDEEVQEIVQRSDAAQED